MRYQYDRSGVVTLLEDVCVAGSAVYPVVEGFFQAAGIVLWKTDLRHRALNRGARGLPDIRDPRSLLALIVNDEVLRVEFAPIVGACGRLTSGLNSALHPEQVVDVDRRAGDFHASRDHILQWCADPPWPAGESATLEVDAASVMLVLDAVVCVAEAWGSAMDASCADAVEPARRRDSARDAVKLLSQRDDFGPGVQSQADDLRRIANSVLHPSLEGQATIPASVAAERADELADHLQQAAFVRGCKW